MAITQDRMMALVRAADSAMHKLQELRGICQQAVANDDANEGLNHIAKAIASVYYAMTQGEIEVIVSERVHYKHAEHRNNRAAARARRARGKALETDSAFLTRDDRPKAQFDDSLLDDTSDGELELPGGGQ